MVRPKSNKRVARLSVTLDENNHAELKTHSGDGGFTDCVGDTHAVPESLPGMVTG